MRALAATCVVAAFAACSLPTAGTRPEGEPSSSSSAPSGGFDGSGGATGGAAGEGGAPPRCGDGTVHFNAGEACDDGGMRAGDGCDDACAIEHGWSCELAPSVCSTECGDGLVASTEACDDGGTSPGDGCNQSCQPEHGWSCRGEPSTCASECGDGIIALGLDSAEECDDGDVTSGDGCSTSCTVENGWGCTAEPSLCTVAQPVVVGKGPNLAITIVDDAYNGMVSSMQCVTMNVPGDDILTVSLVRVTLGLEHPFLGDLVCKVISPSGTVTTLFSRPGRLEPLDDGDNTNGDSSDFSRLAPLLFYDGAPDDAEDMGAALSMSEDVCEDDGKCEWDPNNGAGPGANGLAEFAGELPAGIWQVCLGDADPADIGTIDLVTLEVTSD